MDEQVICYKQDVLNPREFKFKQCPEGQFCHGGLNRCAMDPYSRVVDRNPGNKCTQNYQCKSKHCSKQDGVCTVPLKPVETLTTCTDHAQCNVGYYCGVAASNSGFQLADPSRQTEEFKGVCKPQRQEFDSCTSDFDCENNLACADRKCQRYGSIEDYGRSDNYLACKSGFVSNNYCHPTPTIVSEQQGPDYKCKSVADFCVYESHNQAG